jgi:hypothetical protein
MCCRRTVWPGRAARIADCDCVVGICSLHFRVKETLHVRRTVITLEIALLFPDSPCHVHRLCPADLEAKPLRVFARIQQFKLLVLKGDAERSILPFRRNLVGVCRAADHPVDYCQGFLWVRIVVGVWCTRPSIRVRSTAG